MEVFLVKVIGNYWIPFDYTKIQCMISQFAKGSFESLDDVYYNKNKQSLGLSLEEFDRLSKFEHWHISDMQTIFFERPFKISSPYWFLHSVDEIFVQEVYKFQTDNPQPVIIDCGASWGLSVIYFKLKFPQAAIIAYEADQDIYESALDNLKAFDLNDVVLLNMAVWDADCSLVFSSEGSVGGSVADLGMNSNSSDYADAPPESWVGNYNTYLGIHKTMEKKVEAVRLKHVLRKYPAIDFLKVDIEGAEHKVILDCATELYRVDKMFIEYHSVPNHPQTLDEILKVVRNSGFRYYIKEASNNFSHPFVKDKDVLYDLQLNIFCFR